MTAVYDRAAKALAALDFTEENEMIAAHAAEGERLSAASVLEMFAPLADKGPAASVRVPTYAGVPDDRSNVGVLAGMRKRMEDMQATR